MSDDLNVNVSLSPPNTKLTEALVIFQDLFRKHPYFQMMDQVDVLAKILDEEGNNEEIRRFLASYLIPPDFERAMSGMAVMAILGFMLGKGEEKTKGMIL